MCWRVGVFGRGVCVCVCYFLGGGGLFWERGVFGEGVFFWGEREEVFFWEGWRGVLLGGGEVFWGGRDQLWPIPFWPILI